MTRRLRLWLFLACTYAATHVLLMAFVSHAWIVTPEIVTLTVLAPLAQAAVFSGVLKASGADRP